MKGGNKNSYPKYLFCELILLFQVTMPGLQLGMLEQEGKFVRYTL